MLGGLSLGTAALGTAFQVVELPVLGGSMDLGHLGRMGSWAGMETHRLPPGLPQAGSVAHNIDNGHQTRSSPQGLA